MKRQLVAGAVLLGAVAAGAVAGLLLVAPSGPDPEPRPSPVPSPTTESPAPPGADVAAVNVVAKAIADAITRHDSAAYGKLTCRPQTAEALTALQRTWDAAGEVTATLPKPPDIRGESATVVVHVEGAAGLKNTPFPLHRIDGRWCVPG
ncbi:hypothetical protein [Amycolatopsis samaneae]|uniref:DUF4878 domain-containing protein n=1 Tax=Amycolatopsis samaneae TaxID=664691 RepID=A0ABW5GQG7_9PSEU